MSAITDLFSALLARGADEQIRGLLRAELQASDSWDWTNLRGLVLAHPGADGPRLLAADWLEEEGEDWRAELIRLQCRWAFRLDICGAGALAAPEAAALRPGLEALLQPLLAALPRDWFAFGEAARAELSEDGAITVRDGGMALAWVRGFVSRIEMPTPGFLARAGQMFRTHPIKAVRLSDKTPAKAIGGNWWWTDSCLDPTEPACLARYIPAELYRHLTGGIGRLGRLRQGVRPADLTFANPEAAQAALSAACVGYGRSHAEPEAA